MRRLALLLSMSVVAVACGKTEPPPPPPPPPPVAPPPPPPIDLAAVAGKWDFKVMGATGDSVLTTYTLVATADTKGWTVTYPKHKPLPVMVTVSGDSVMVSVPEHESMLRKGVKVTNNTVYHMVGGNLMANTMAHYMVKTADSVATLRGEGMKAMEKAPAAKAPAKAPAKKAPAKNPKSGG